MLRKGFFFQLIMVMVLPTLGFTRSELSMCNGRDWDIIQWWCAALHGAMDIVCSITVVCIFVVIVLFQFERSGTDTA